MKKSAIVRILLAVAAAVCLGIFFIRLFSGASLVTAGLWIALAVILGIIAAAIKVDEDKATPSVIGSTATLVAALMVFSFLMGRSTSPERTAQLPAPTEAAETEISYTVNPTSFVTVKPTATPRPTPKPTPTSNPTPSPVPTPSPTPGPQWHYNGMYKVGVDIPAGEYFLIATGSYSAYFELSKDSTGTLSSIIANDNFDTFRYVTVKDGEYFSITRGKFVSVDELAPLVFMSTLSEGMYKVGRDIPAGEYKIVCDSDYNAYYEVAKDSRHQISSIVANDNFSGTKYITVKDGQYLTVVRGYFVSVG